MSNTYPTGKQASLRTIAMPADANPYGDIFGGWIMSQMDIAGASYATLIAKQRVVTIAVDAMSFLLPVHIGDEICCFCETEHIGTTSIKVRIETWARRNRLANEYIKVTEGSYTFVAIDEDRKPVAINK